MGFLFTLLGVITTIVLWKNNIILAIVALIATLYQASSLNEMTKSARGKQPDNEFQTSLNMIASIIIIILFISSFFV